MLGMPLTPTQTETEQAHLCEFDFSLVYVVDLTKKN